MHVSFVIRLDISNKLSNREHPVVIQITWGTNVRKKRIKGYSSTKENWDFSNHCYLRPKTKNKEINAFLSKCEKVYRNHFDEGFNYKKFTQLLRIEGEPIKVKDKRLIETCYEVAQEKVEEGALNSAGNYKGLASALLKSFPKDIRLSDFDESHIKQFYHDCTERGCKAYNYLKFLKILFNKAIDKDYVDIKNCPFKTLYNRKGFDISKYRHKPSKFSKKSRIKDLSKEELQVIIDYYENRTVSEKERYYMSLWMLSYRFFGVNFMDLTLMKWNDIQNGYWLYSRSKTGVTSDTGKPVHEKAMALLRELDSGGEYILDVRNGCENEETCFKEYKRVKDNALKCYIRISKKIGFEGGRYFTFYTGRYTAPTLALSNGVNINVVKTLMDHKNIKTTNRYLGMVKDREKLKQAMDVLDV